MRHPFWLSGDNVLCDSTPHASACDLRAVRPHLSHLYLVSVTCDSRGGVSPLSAPPPHAALATAAVAGALALALLAYRRRLLARLHYLARRLLVLLLARSSDDGFLQRQSARNLTLAALAALLRHRTGRQLRSPKLAAAVAVGLAATTAASAAAVAAAATLLGIPFRLPTSGADGYEEWRSTLAPLRPLVERMRPVLHAYLLPWLVRPALRLNSTAIHRAAGLLQGTLRVSFTFPSDKNDGLVDLPSHVGMCSSLPPSPNARRPSSPQTLRHSASAEALTRHSWQPSSRPSRGQPSRGQPSRGQPSRGQPSTLTGPAGFVGDDDGRRNASGDGTDGNLDTDGGRDGRAMRMRGTQLVAASRSNLETKRRARTNKGEGASDARESDARESDARQSDARDALEHPFPVGGGTRRRPTARRVMDGPPLRNFSLSDVSTASQSSHVLGPAVGHEKEAPEQEPVRLEKGRWHILRVEGADHSLGTWASEKSDEMYRELVCLLDAHQRQRP